jgi:hypothetical protein
MADENVWMFVVWRITSWWRLFFVSRPGCPSKAVPVLAAFAMTIAAEAKVILAFVAAGTVIVKLILDMFLTTTIA